MLGTWGSVPGQEIKIPHARGQPGPWPTAPEPGHTRDCVWQLEKVCAPQQRPSTAKIKSERKDRENLPQAGGRGGINNEQFKLSLILSIDLWGRRHPNPITRAGQKEVPSYLLELVTETSASLTMPKPLTVWITINCGKFLREYQTTLPASWETCMQVKKQQLELDREQRTGSKLGKEFIKAVYCHPAYLTYMQSTSWEMLDWMKHKLESTFLGEISVTSDTQMTLPSWQKA